MTLRLAIIHPAERAHEYRQAICRLSDADIVAIVDSNAVEVKRFGVELGAKAIASSLSELLETNAPSFDAVVIHSPVRQRGELVCLAAEAGKHVLVDAPLAASVEEAQRAIQACDAAGVCLMAGQSLRFMPYQRAVRESLDTGQLGAPGLLRIHHWNTQGDPSDGGSWADAVAELTIREVDVACWLFGAAPETVFSIALSVDEPYRGLQLHLGFPRGGMALIDCNRVLQPSSDPYFSLTLIGSKGAVYADDHHNTNLLFRAGTSGQRVGQGSEYVRFQLQEFVDAVTEERPPRSTGEEAVRAMAVVQAAIDSMRSQRVAWRQGDRYELR